MSAVTHSLDHCGCALSYTIRGEGPPVVFIQGTGLHGGGWAPQVDELSERFTCLTFDNRGMGLSQPVGAPVSVGQMAQDTLAILDALGWATAHVVGHSLGGLVAQELALRARSRVKSLSLLCTFPRGKDATGLTPRMLWLGLRSFLGTRRMRRLAFLKMVMPPDDASLAERNALAESLAPLFGHDLADHPPIVRQQFAAMSVCDLTPRLHELSGIPTLVVTAAHDPVAKVAPGKVLAAAIRGARHVEFEDASHGVTIQHATRINALLAEHFANAES